MDSATFLLDIFNRNIGLESIIPFKDKTLHSTELCYHIAEYTSTSSATTAAPAN